MCKIVENGACHRSHSPAGRVHSMDTFGTLDGPGIRFVLFMQGCALQCRYCHNRDSWDRLSGKLTTVEEMLGEIEPYVPYYSRSGGGVTASGGEPTLQAPFLAELFTELKSKWRLHTALDTSGYCDPDYADELLRATDLVILDLKLINREKHIALTGQPNERILNFARHLSKLGKPMWLRHVLIPDWTDAHEDLAALGQFIGELQGVEKFEILPYHRMGVYKWQEMGLAYPLEGCRSPTDQEVDRAYRIVEQNRLGTASPV